jgi:hypothetical protein
MAGPRRFLLVLPFVLATEPWAGRGRTGGGPLGCAGAGGLETRQQPGVACELCIK